MFKYRIKNPVLLPTVEKVVNYDNCVDIFSVKDLLNGDYLSPLSDVVFKAVFLSENFRPYLITFLAYFLKMPKRLIKEKAIIKESHLHKRNIDQKTEVADLIVEIDGVLISIEVNNTNTLKRNYEYATRMFAEDVQMYEDGYNYKEVVQININNFTLGNSKTYDYYENKNDDGELYIRMRIYQIYLPNIKKKYYNGFERKSALKKWELYIWTLFESDRKLVNKLIEGDGYMTKYVEQVENVLASDGLLRAYDHHAEEMKFCKIMMEKQLIEKLKPKIQEEVREEVKAEERAEGRAEGRTEGKIEGIFEVARNLLKAGLPLDKIATYTGLSYKDIEGITP